MSKEDSTPAGGLLSKVVRFVRNPTVNWTELDSLPDDRESQYSKQMLKEMIERKRRNDFVRRREFDQLRKLRQREVLQGQRTEDPTARPSFFQSSMASPDERAVTLKKIDEIEAQMSQQWWKSKQGVNHAAPGAASAQAAAAAARHEPLAGMDAAAAARAYAPTAPVSLTAALDALGSKTPEVAPLFADDSMPIAHFGGTDAPMLGDALSQVAGGASFNFAAAAAAAAPAPEPEEFVHEPDLEEAAIRFANGDHAGAEAGLLDVLEQHKLNPPEEQLEIWMTLFDLYRAVGLHDKFDTLAIDFAAQYSRSAPLWFSMPEQLGIATETPAAEAEQAMAAHRDFSWNAPAVLALSSVAALQASVARAASPWTLSWSRLSSIEDAAVALLADQFTRWADADMGQFVFSGVEVLNALLEAKAQSGDRSASAEWWRLRLAALRLMGKADEFELVALDFCVTYEVSPPSWVAPRCGYSDNEGSISGPAPLAADSDFMMSDLGVGLTGTATLDAPPAAQLSGHIDGDATPLLVAFEGQFRTNVPLNISCDKLIRVDFSAAGSVLNWAAEQQAQGRAIHFTNLQRLVAIFFNVIGISEHAWVIPRKN
jgi:ABC-type transporter Mla MlaB component